MESEANTQKPATESSAKKTVKRPNKKVIITVAIVALLALAGWALYTKGYNSGKKQGEADYKQTLQNRSEQQLQTLPASGEVSAISGSEITIKLIGGETRTASINKETNISGKTGTLKAEDIKKGSRAIVFTKPDGKKRVATRIVVQQ